MALRSFARLGSSVSILGLAGFGSSLSVLNCVHLGSAMSLRSFARLGSSCSVLDYANLGSSLSLRGCLRVGRSIQFRRELADQAAAAAAAAAAAGTGSGCGAGCGAGCGTGVGCGETMDGTSIMYNETTGYAFPNGEPPPPYDADGNPGAEKLQSQLLFMVDNQRAMNVMADRTEISATEQLGLQVYTAYSSDTGERLLYGELHGTWTAQSQIATSDRRLKKDIKPLERHLPSGGERTGEAGSTAKPEDPPLWVLRQLRPVSFNFKESGDKGTRYGFIADELASVVPDVVRNLPPSPARQKFQGDGPDIQAVHYQDLIALLTAVAKSQQVQVSELTETNSHVAKQLIDMKSSLESHTKIAREFESAQQAGGSSLPKESRDHDTTQMTVTSLMMKQQEVIDQLQQTVSEMAKSHNAWENLYKEMAKSHNEMKARVEELEGAQTVSEMIAKSYKEMAKSHKELKARVGELEGEMKARVEQLEVAQKKPDHTGMKEAFLVEQASNCRTKIARLEEQFSRIWESPAASQSAPVIGKPAESSFLGASQQDDVKANLDWLESKVSGLQDQLARMADAATKRTRADEMIRSAEAAERRVQADEFRRLADTASERAMGRGLRCLAAQLSNGTPCSLLSDAASSAAGNEHVVPV